MIVYTDKHRVPFQIDEDDYEAVSHYSWHIEDSGYPRTHVGKRPTACKLLLHAFLLGRAPEGFEWDHINRDRLDNQRHNIRIVTHTVNTRNVGLSRRNKSGVKGVNWDTWRGKWRASIRNGGPKIHVGYFDILTEAIAARLTAEQELWGENR